MEWYLAGLGRIWMVALSTFIHRPPVPHRRFCTVCHRGRSSDRSYSSCILPTCFSWLTCHHLHPQAYADDTQIYGFCNPLDADLLQERMSVCVNEVSLWMTSNRLLLNPTKTKVLRCSSARRQHQIPVGPVCIGNTSVLPVSAVRDLGIYIDADLTMSTHVTTAVGACFVALWWIRSVRRSLTPDAVLTLLHALVITSVDYCCSVLTGVSGALVQRLQSVMNAAARLVFSVRRSENTTPLLRELHWLKVPERIQFGCVFWRIVAYIALCLCTLLRCLIGWLMWLHIAVSGLLRRRHWSYRWHVDPPSVTAHFRRLRLARGILYRHPSEISSHSLHSDRNWSWPCSATLLPDESSIWWTVSHV